jgi:hypothetical protein
MAEENKTGAEQAVRALHDFLGNYIFGRRHLWMHDFATEFEQGEAYGLTGLALIPEVRTALDTLSEQLGVEPLGPELEQWHESFKPGENQ